MLGADSACQPCDSSDVYGPPWPTEVSPLTDPTVQISRSGFLKLYSPFSKSA